MVPNDPSSSNQQAPVYHQQASSSLTNFNWLPGADTPTQYVSIHVIWVVKLSGRRFYKPNPISPSMDCQLLCQIMSVMKT